MIAVGKGGQEAIRKANEEEEVALLLALRAAFDRIDEDKGGTLDREEVKALFNEERVEISRKELSTIMEVASDNEIPDGEDEAGITFQQFSVWVQSSSALAAKLRNVLGGALDDKLDRDVLAIEEREEYTGWINVIEGDLAATVFVLLEEPQSSKGAKLISSWIMTLILFSSLMYVLSTVDSLVVNHETLFEVQEWVCIVHFTVEYVVRIACCSRRPYRDQRVRPYVLQIMNLVDLASIVPFYIEKILGAGVSVGVLRVLRLARIFRVFKVGSYAKNLAVVAEALKRSSTALSLLVYLLAIFVVISSSIMHMLEFDSETMIPCCGPIPTAAGVGGDGSSSGAGVGEPLYTSDEWAAQCDDLHCKGFESIPQACWFTIVTMTSVGYGDYSPQTKLGKLMACVIMISGVLAIAIPITLIGNKFNEAWIEARAAEMVAGARQDLKHATDAGKVEFNKEEERLVHQGHEVDAHFELVYQLLRCGTTRTQDIRFEQAIAALEGVYTPPVWPGPGADPEVTTNGVHRTESTYSDFEA